MVRQRQSAGETMLIGTYKTARDEDELKLAVATRAMLLLKIWLWRSRVDATHDEARCVARALGVDAPEVRAFASRVVVDHVRRRS